MLSDRFELPTSALSRQCSTNWAKIANREGKGKTLIMGKCLHGRLVLFLEATISHTYILLWATVSFFKFLFQHLGLRSWTCNHLSWWRVSRLILQFIKVSATILQFNRCSSSADFYVISKLNCPVIKDNCKHVSDWLCAGAHSFHSYI